LFAKGAIFALLFFQTHVGVLSLERGERVRKEEGQEERRPQEL